MPVQLVKAIKPKPFKMDTVRLELLNALRKEGTACIDMLKQTTANWEGDKPTFASQISLTGGNATLTITPTGAGADKWNWIDLGTPPHVIVPKRARRLRFRVGGRSGSRPGTLRTTRAIPGNTEVFAKRVLHPGIKARGWSRLIQDAEFPKYYSAMSNAVAIGIEKSTR